MKFKIKAKKQMSKGDVRKRKIFALLPRRVNKETIIWLESIYVYEEFWVGKFTGNEYWSRIGYEEVA